ncbi:MAG TPA: histidine phosphatase family protein [Longimicrobiaceae bacterium]|jgi:phosphohistidine phosphatase|nr:histidine phosphatase family protein [Longimicrobiaceae bacterium]
MKLLVIRHAFAGDREEFARTGLPDSLRPLTDEGRKKMQGAARGLHRLVPELDVLAASPLTRAVQTAEVVAARYDGMETATVAELAPEEAPDALVPWLRTHAADATVAVVGHEPHLGFLAGWLLTGRNVSFLEPKKGGAFLLEFEGESAAGGAKLRWALTPRQLRDLGRK